MNTLTFPMMWVWVALLIGNTTVNLWDAATGNGLGPGQMTTSG